MEKEQRSPSFSYLLEIILACIIGLACFCFCVIFLIKSARMQQQALAQNDAATIAQSQISILKSQAEAPLSGSVSYNEELLLDEDGIYHATWLLIPESYGNHGSIEIYKDNICLLQIPFSLETTGERP